MSGPGDDRPETGGVETGGDGSGPVGDPGTGGFQAPPIRVGPGSRVAQRRRAARPVPGRTTVLVAVVVILLGVGIVSWTAPPPSAPGESAAEGTAVSPVDAHASSFFCATGAGEDAGAGAQESIVLTDTTGNAAVGVASTQSSAGGSPTVTNVHVPARGSVTVSPPPGPSGSATATTFSFSQGGVTGTAIVSGSQGWSTAPCATAVSPQWDFAGGSTTTGLLDLSLYNPTAATTMVNLTFLTVGGTVLDPQAYQGLALSPGQLVVEGLGAYVQNQSVVATLVQATSGSLVATELDDMAVSSGTGLALLTGVRTPSSTWQFAQTTAVAGGSVTLAVANPGTTSVSAQVTAGLPGASVVPHQVIVPAKSVATFAPSSTAGWPLGAPYALTVTATGPVIVGRTVIAPAGGASPQGGVTMGSTTAAPSWLVVGPGVPGAPVIAGGLVHNVALADPGSSPVVATVSSLTTGATLVTARVPAHGVIVLAQPEISGLQPLIVSATGPVTVEADEAPTGAPGVVASSGFALGN